MAKRKPQLGEKKISVLGMVERGGRRQAARRRVSPGGPLKSSIWANVQPESIVFTDDWVAYKPHPREYAGHRIIATPTKSTW